VSASGTFRRRALASTVIKTHATVIAQRFGDWMIRAELEGGYVEAVCLVCNRTFERSRFSIVSGESRRCGECGAQRRSA